MRSSGISRGWAVEVSWIFGRVRLSSKTYLHALVQCEEVTSVAIAIPWHTARVTHSKAQVRKGAAGPRRPSRRRSRPELSSSQGVREG